MAGFIKQQRLEHIRTDLTARHLSHLTAHAIAARWGYVRPAVFSRAFRAAYGEPPGEYRPGSDVIGDRAGGAPPRAGCGDRRAVRADPAAGLRCR
ncbi:helix-turn-helix domain-containing protein [Streptomyces pakalii]|uniref:helix-turn-helix domain-containing protein n=1 Tax=Streptomyces pakalii TaxID=3036494 RepID=UPI0037D99D66